jgi:hypothetical protein
MTPAELVAWYRENAVTCVAIAKGINDVGKKLLLLDMAQAWANLAVELGNLDGSEEVPRLM